MADENYKVEAELELKSNVRKEAGAAATAFDRVAKTGKNARQALNSVTKEVNTARRSLGSFAGGGMKALRVLGNLGTKAGDLGRKFTQAGRGLGSFAWKLMQLPTQVRAVYASIAAIARLFGRAAGTAIGLNSTVEDMSVRLAAVRVAVDGLTFGAAQQSAHGLFRQLEEIAIQSPATGAELSGIFADVYGPLRRAGAGMEELLNLSRDAAVSAGLLGVDYAQLARDVRMMSEGRAGLDVRTFSGLRSLGIVRETTEEFNRMSAPERMRRIVDAFESLGGPAAAAFGRTWTGISSTFRGLVEQFIRVFSADAFNEMKRQLRGVNDFLLSYRKNIESVLRVLGKGMADLLAGVGRRTSTILRRIVRDADQITRRIDRAIARGREMLPGLLRVASTMAAVTIAMRTLGPLLGALGAIGTMLSGLTGLAGLFGGGGAAAAGGAGAAAGVAGGGALATIGTVLLPVVLALASIFTGLVAAGSVVGVTLWRLGGQISQALRPLMPALSEFGSLLLDLGSALWAGLGPLLSYIGVAFMQTVVPAVSLVAGIFMELAPYLRQMIAVFRTWMVSLGRQLDAMAGRTLRFIEMLTTATSALGGFDVFLRRIFGGAITPAPGVGAGAGPGGPVSEWFSGLMEAFRRPAAEQQRPTEGPAARAPGARPATNIDMRGSRITVNQEFREADPDRVMIQMQDAMARGATRRVQSAFAPALSR